VARVEGVTRSLVSGDLLQPDGELRSNRQNPVLVALLRFLWDSKHWVPSRHINANLRFVGPVKLNGFAEPQAGCPETAIQELP